MTRHVRQVQLGDHLCLPFTDDELRREVLTTYIADGLRRGERILYLADQTPPETIDRWLARQDVDGALAIARGQLDVRAGGHPDVLLGVIRDQPGRARADGYQGLRLTSEMSLALRHQRLADFESGVERTVGGTVAAICQYDERVFDRDAVDEVVAAHDSVVRVDPLHDGRPVRIVPTLEPRGLKLAGDVDERSHLALADALHRAAAWPDIELRIDLSEVGFIDVAGVRTLVRAARALAPGRRLRIAHLAPTLRRVIELAGWDRTPGLVLEPDPGEVERQ